MAYYNIADGNKKIPKGEWIPKSEQDTSKFAYTPWIQTHEWHSGGDPYREERQWDEMMLDLSTIYGKKQSDLKVGDKIGLFYLPTYSTLKSLFVDMVESINGFTFALKLDKGGVLTAPKARICEYDKHPSDPTSCASGTGISKVSPKTAFEVKDIGETANGFVNTSYRFSLDNEFDNGDLVYIEIQKIPTVNSTQQIYGDLDIRFFARYEANGRI